jgi:hypothetical protein
MRWYVNVRTAKSGVSKESREGSSGVGRLATTLRVEAAKITRDATLRRAVSQSQLVAKAPSTRQPEVLESALP